MQLRRREFLALAPAGTLMAGAVGGGSAFAACGGAGHSHASSGTVEGAARLGYWDGSDVEDAVDLPFELRSAARPEISIRPGREVPRLATATFDAADLLAGDPRFLLGPARVRILGMIDPTAAASAALPSLSLQVKSDPVRGFVHEAWGFQNGEIPSVSSPLELVAPVHHTGGLHLAVVQTSADGVREETDIVLTSGLGAGAKLRRGLYLLSWGADRATDWSSFSVVPTETDASDAPTAYRIAARGLAPTTLDAAVLAFSIDLA